MICGYENIYDLCSKKYSYQYKNVIFNGTNLVADSGPLAPVIRKNNITGKISIIGPASETPIEDCDVSIENESISDWGCYQIYIAVFGGAVDPPSLETFKQTQILNITQNYDITLNNGIQVVLSDNTNIFLAAALDDQIQHRNALASAQTLYNEDPDNVMPSITDINKLSHQFDYLTINSIFQEYFRQIIYYKNLKDILISKVNQSTTVDEVNSNSWNSNIPLYSTEIPMGTRVQQNNNGRIPCELKTIKNSCTTDNDCGAGRRCCGDQCVECCDSTTVYTGCLTDCIIIQNNLTFCPNCPPGYSPVPSTTTTCICMRFCPALP